MYRSIEVANSPKAGNHTKMPQLQLKILLKIIASLLVKKKFLRNFHRLLVKTVWVLGPVPVLVFTCIRIIANGLFSVFPTICIIIFESGSEIIRYKALD